jgi:hypothetical protein
MIYQANISDFSSIILSRYSRDPNIRANIDVSQKYPLGGHDRFHPEPVQIL